MGYRAYPDYKESGVTGLDRVPSHWTTWKATHGFSRIGSGTTPKSDNASYYDGDIPWVTTSELREKPILETQAKLTAQAIRDYPTLKTYSPHSLIIAMYGATIGRLGILEIEATVNQACCVFSDPEQFDTKFFYYWLWMWRPTLLALSAGGGQPNLSQDTLKQIRVPAPSVPEQQKIAKFLDHKTAQIDRLIEKKQELIEKLYELRTAVTTQAVTMGVTSRVAIKKSNVLWFDSLPSHWQVIRLKDLVVDAIAGPYGSSLTKSMYTNSGYRVYGQQQVIPEDFAIGDYYIPDEKYEEMQRYRTRPGDILISVMGTIGRAALVPDDAEQGIINPRLVLYRANERIVRPEYLKSFINSRPSQSYFSLVAQGTTMEGINMALIGELAVAVPPLSEQDEVLLAQQARTARLEKQIQSVASAIARLQEYRTALITAAVTGQIDVRAWQAPASTEDLKADKEVA